MSLMTWTKEQFGTDVTVHDQEHQTIFAMVNALAEAVKAGERKSIGNHLDALIAFVAKHFASEEGNMAKAAFSQAAAHKAEHDKLVTTCLDLQKQFHAGAAEITADTLRFVRDWLQGHIPSLDRSYGPALNAAGVR